MVLVLEVLSNVLGFSTPASQGTGERDCQGDSRSFVMRCRFEIPPASQAPKEGNRGHGNSRSSHSRMKLMKLSVECYSGRKADERPVRFCLDGNQYQVEAVLDQWYDPQGTSTRFKPTTGISILFGNKRRRPRERGIWFHFTERIRSADQICRAYNARFKAHTNTPATVRMVGETSG